MGHALDELFRIMQSRLESAQQRFNGAQDDYMKRYYKGQVDTLSLVLYDIEFELGIERHEDIRQTTTQEQDVPDAQEQPPTDSQSVSPAPKEQTSEKTEKPRKSKKRKKVEIPDSPYKPLAHAAIKQGIIIQKASHFGHPLLPGSHVQGFPRLYKALEDDEILRQTLQSALQEAAVPDETQAPE